MPGAVPRTANPDRPAAPRSRDSWVVPLLSIGSVSVVLWVVGAVLLCRSSVFSVRDKLLGLLVLPGGLFPAALFLASESSTSCHPAATACTVPLARGPLGLLVLAVLVALPVGSCAVLLARLRTAHHAGVPAAAPTQIASAAPAD